MVKGHFCHKKNISNNNNEFYFQASAGVKDDVLESYCWMYAHFQIPKEYIGPCSGKDQESIEGPIYNSYYQWIPIYLMFLAILFYLPRMLWMVMEGNDLI